MNEFVGQLEGKVIIVTGAGGTLGAAVVAACRREGAGVVSERVEVTRQGEVEDFIKKVVSHYNRIDGLVNCAAIVRDGLVLKMSEGAWDEVMDVNLKGVYNFTKAVLRPMIRQREGKVINIASRVGLQGGFGQANYAAAKGGLIAFTKSVAREVGKWNIRANVVCPGFFISKMTEELPPEVRERAKSESALGEFCEPDEVADFIAYLLSNKVRHVTGQVFVWDSRIIRL